MQFGSMSVMNLLYSLCKETLQYMMYENRQLVQINELCKETSQQEKDLPNWPHQTTFKAPCLSTLFENDIWKEVILQEKHLWLYFHTSISWLLERQNTLT